MRVGLLRRLAPAGATVAAAAALACCAFALASAIASPQRADHARRGRPPTLGAATSPAQAGASFGLKLLGELGGGNAVVSPDSLEAALAMAGEGARGATAAQIAHTLELPSPSAFAAVGGLQRRLAGGLATASHGSPQPPTLLMGTGMFVQQGFALKEPFVASLRQGFGANPQPVDFEHDLSGAVHTINGWVEEQTRGVIPKAIESVPAKTVLALADAIYLHAYWVHPFEASHTKPAPFHALGAATQSVPFMNETETFPYGRGRGWSAVELPYAGSTLSLLVVLPGSEGLAALQRRLGPDLLARVVRSLSDRPVALSLPRFHISLSSSLVAPLEALGMKQAFRDDADFTAIADAPPLKIGEVRHDADIAVAEEGTTAAAATIVTIEATSAHVFTKRPVPFVADHPFLFFLRDGRTGAVLFAGRLADAASAQG
jgi:serpin B